MTETSPTHSEDPAEGADTGVETETSGRTPHAEQPAEGRDDESDAARGLDPANRITGI